MEVLLRREAPCVARNGKVDADEEIIRHALLRSWLKLLEKYTQYGAFIPTAPDARQEMLKKGVEAGVSAICDEHWFVFRWMVEDEIQAKVEQGLSRLDLEQFIKNVRVAQSDPGMLQYLRDEIRSHVLFDDVN